MEAIKSVVIVGSGNVATALLAGLCNVGIKVSQLVARNPLTGKELSQKYGCEWVSDVRKVDQKTDAVFLCVQDDQLPYVISQLPKMEAILMHTSGSTGISVFRPQHKHFGVFYPMQTFSAQQPVQWTQIPVYLEGSNPQVEAKMLELALKMSSKVQFLSSESRMQLHVAAVFACNFTNLLLSAAADLMKQNGLEFNDLKQLVETTIEKAFAAGHPSDVQTGPAVRNDQSIINKHLKSLSLNPDLEKLYALLSEEIKRKRK